MHRLAVLGHPVAHSLSPPMQNAALRAVGLGETWAYEAIDVAPADFAARVAAMPGEGFVGINVTIPHKVAALELADDAGEAAREIGAANTLTFSADGRVEAANTDAPGLLAALPESPAGSRALVLGAGGSARAVVWALVSAGADVAIWNRTATRAAELAEVFGARSLDDAERDEVATAGDFDLLVNTTSVGLGASGGKSHVEAELATLGLSTATFNSDKTVVDLVYGDRDTGLTATAKGAGARTVDGIEVLIHQGAIAFRLWTGVEAPIEAMRAAIRRDHHE